MDTALDLFYSINQIRVEENLAVLPESTLQQIRIAVNHNLSGLVEAGFGLPHVHPNHSLFCTRLLTAYQSNLGLYTKPFPGIEALLQTLDNEQIPWGIVTNKHSTLSNTLLAKLDLAHRAHCIVSGDTTPNPKPHPDPLFHACKEIRQDPANCIYVGDAERDIIAGKKAGMATLCALFGYIENLQDAKLWGADFYVNHPDEIWPSFLSWQKEFQAL